MMSLFPFRERSPFPSRIKIINWRLVSNNQNFLPVMVQNILHKPMELLSCL